MRYWGIHNGIREEEARPDRRGNRVYREVPVDERMAVGDVAYLFDSDHCLYGWGFISLLGDVYTRPGGPRRDVTVTQNFLQYQLRRMDEIRALEEFSNFDRTREENLSSFSERQAQRLRGIFPPNSAPPDPVTVREQAAAAVPLRPVIITFVLGERLRIDETRFDEFKTIAGPNPVNAVLNELDAYVLGFLALEDRRYEEYCRIFWGIDDRHNTVGIRVNTTQRDELRRRIGENINGIEPGLHLRHTMWSFTKS